MNVREAVLLFVDRRVSVRGLVGGPRPRDTDLESSDAPREPPAAPAAPGAPQATARGAGRTRNKIQVQERNPIKEGLIAVKYVP